MKKVVLHNHTFKILMPEKEICAAIRKCAAQISHDMQNAHPLFISVLNGAFMFTAELMKGIDIPDAEVSFIKLSSYSDMNSTGSVSELIGLKHDINGRNIVIVEDMVDSGCSMNYLVNALKEKNPASIRIATLFVKPGALKYPLTIDYPVMALNNDFVVGFGLDYNEYGRQLPDLYTLEK